ncbi:MAG: LamG-like jellyroll fold domain-containing protein [Kangiellaceae bacterium]|jgi:hypothetical protein|nr:LamG-like jellyroll fold domain-containing protein [Kangiellaceae bacterium]
MGNANDERILAYNFNAPLVSFASTGSETAVSAVLTTATGSAGGHPAKKRGIYFVENSDGYLTIENVMLNPSFSVHTWVLLTANNKDQTILSKDRNVFTNTGSDKNLLELRINALGKMEARLARADAPGTVGTKAGSTPVTTGSWKYLVYSFAMTGGDKTTVSFYIDSTTADGSAQDFADTIFVDKRANKMFVGIERTTSETTFDTHFNGFIYDLHVYQSAWDTGVLTAKNGGCAVADTCETIGFM